MTERKEHPNRPKCPGCRTSANWKRTDAGGLEVWCPKCDRAADRAAADALMAEHRAVVSHAYKNPRKP